MISGRSGCLSFPRRDVQIHRVRLRRKMSRPEIEAIIAARMPDRMKRSRADIVVQTGFLRHQALRKVRRLIGDLLA